MLIRKLIQTRKADAELPKEIRTALIESLFAPIASLLVGAIACSIVGAAVALRVGDGWIMANSIAILAVGMVRVASALFYKRSKEADRSPHEYGSTFTSTAPGDFRRCSACSAG